MEEKIRFSEYLNALRIEKKITMTKLSAGLCDHHMIGYIENGERVPDGILQDAIMERLGVGAENYERYVDATDYERWEARQRILANIINEDWELALGLLEEYSKIYDMSNNLEYQFYLEMYAQIRRHWGADEIELCEIFSKAVSLTMPMVEEKRIDELALSIRELNLLLEAEKYRRDGERPERYIEIMKYAEKHFDRVGIAKIYPKAVYLLYGKVHSMSAADRIFWPTKMLLLYCEEALRWLQESSRMYYLWEILSLRDELLKEKIAGLNGVSRKCRIEHEEKQKQNAAWKNALEKVYDDFGVRKDTFEYCYVYAVKGVYCINDVIRIRRKMLGISPQELCRDFCNIKTLRRLEKRETMAQKATMMELFRRLGLSGEYTRTILITQNHEMKLKMMHAIDKANNLMWEEAGELLEEIKEQVSMEDIFNQQTIRRKELYYLWSQKKISRKEYCKRMKDVLELTLPLKSFLEEGEKFLSHIEQICIQNLMQGMDKESEEFETCLCRLEEYYDSYEKRGLLQSVHGMYEIVMSYVESERGNQDKFDCSDGYNRTILEGCLRYRRMLVLPSKLYGRWWNYAERKKKGIPTEEVYDEVEMLEQVVLLSQLVNQPKREAFYRQKLNMVKNTVNKG